MSRRYFTTVTTIAALLVGSTTDPAHAQTARPCGSFGDLAEALSQRFAERPVAFGVQGNGNLLQIFASADGRTFTVVTTTPTGLACIVAEGVRWNALGARPDGPLA